MERGDKKKKKKKTQKIRVYTITHRTRRAVKFIWFFFSSSSSFLSEWKACGLAAWRPCARTSRMEEFRDSIWQLPYIHCFVFLFYILQFLFSWNVSRCASFCVVPSNIVTTPVCIHTRIDDDEASRRRIRDILMKSDECWVTGLSGEYVRCCWNRNMQDTRCLVRSLFFSSSCKMQR
jgi:hypothetical protein